MTQVESRELRMLAIIRKLAEPGAGLSSDEFADERCVFCEVSRMLPPTYEWRENATGFPEQVMLDVPPMEHKAGCILLEARAIIKEMSA